MKKSKTRYKKPLTHERVHAYYVRIFFPMVSVVLLASLWLGRPGAFAQAPHKQQKGVLAYATSMSVSALLSGTNQQRAANGVAGLQLNSKLNAAAQAKANDMAARNYWSHETPEGNPPWIFFDQAGYVYELAGENLAYGFLTADDAITGWMNSPGHRANLLNTGFQEVGFGFANAPSYQNNGPQTIVVAEYGRPHPALGAQPVAAAPASPAPAATPKKVAAAQPTPTPAAAQAATPVMPKPAEQPKPAPKVEEPPIDPTLAPQGPIVTSAPVVASAQAEQPKPITRLQLMAGQKLTWAPIGVAIMGSFAAFGLVFKHGLILHRVLRGGSMLFLHHPMLDVALVSMVGLSVFLSQITGFVR